MILTDSIKDYINLVTNALAGLASEKHMNKAEMQRTTMDARKNFITMAGKTGKDWDTVTWNDLFKYITRKDQFAFDPENAKSLLTGGDSKTAVAELLRGERLLSTPESLQGMRNTWNKKDGALGGEGDASLVGERAKIIVSYFLERAAIVKKADTPDPDAGRDMPDENPVQSQQTPAVDPSNTTVPSGVDAQKLNVIKTKLAQLKQGAP